MDDKIQTIASVDIDSLALTSTKAYQNACAMLMMVKSVIKEVQDTFQPIKSKTHAAWKETISQEKRHLTVLLEAEKKLKQKILEYTQAADDAEDLRNESVSYRNEWKFEVLDEALIPREFMMINESLIRERVRSLGDVAQIPGVKIWQDKTVVAARGSLTSGLHQ